MKFSDPVDQGSHLAALHNDSAVEMQRRKAAPQQVKNAKGQWPTTECIDCGEDIEAVRLEMGRIRCFSCQDLLEKVEKQHAKR